MAARTLEDFGLRGATEGGPAWQRENPFLVKASRTETRRFSVGLRLLVAVLLLSGLLLGGLWLQRAYPRPLKIVLAIVLGTPFPTALFVVLSFVHVILVTSARTALTVSLGEEARRGTLPDLLLTPLRRAEMLLAMGVGPARTAFLVALAGLPFYVLLVEFGGLAWGEVALLYVLFAVLSYAPPTYALPTSPVGEGPTLVTQPVLTQRARRHQASGGGPLSTSWLFPVLSLFFFGRFLSSFGLFTGGWLGHLGAALHITLGVGGRFLVLFAWPYLVVQTWSRPVQLFHASLPPLVFVLPLMVLNWAAGALSSGAALSVGDERELQSSPAYSRAQTMARWVARAAGLAALGLVWVPWVESGDVAVLAGGSPGQSNWNAAGLALILGALCLPNVCRRALGAGAVGGLTRLRPPGLVLRRTLKRVVRPLGVALATFSLTCLLGGLSPFAPAVYQTVGRLALTALATALWSVGLARLLPVAKRLGDNLTFSQSPTVVHFAILYILPVAVLAVPVPALWTLAALSPASAWVRLLPGAAETIQRFPLYHLGLLPPFPVCLAGACLVGAVLMAWRPLPARSSPPSPKRRGEEVGTLAGGVLGTPAGDALSEPPPPPVSGGRRLVAGGFLPAPERNQTLTASLLAWITARTDNPLFTYEIRTRTRSGKWADWRFIVPGIFLGVCVLAAAYPDVVQGIALVASPFHFFGPTFPRFGRLGIGGPATIGNVWPNLASLLLVMQVYVFGLRGQTVGETLIARDRQRGIWGFILLTPLSARQIFRGKVFGQTFGFAAAWAVLSACELILYGLSVPIVGMRPALIAWLSGQAFVAALFLLGVGLGAALATFPIFMKTLRGASTLLFVGLVGAGLWLNLQLMPLEQQNTWGPMVAAENTWGPLVMRLAVGCVYALVLTLPLFAYAEWRVGRLRGKDVAFGDGVEG